MTFIKIKFRQLKIAQKLGVIITLTATIAIVLAITGLSIYDNVSQKKVLKSEMLVLGKITAQRSGAAIAFLNQSDAEDNLAALHLKKMIGITCLYDRSGQVFASMMRSPVELQGLGIRLPNEDQPNGCPKALREPGVYFDQESIAVHARVMQGSLRVGDLFILAGLTEIRERQFTFILVGIVVMCIGLFVSLLATTPLKRQITSPILELGKVARKVQNENDYTVRAEVKNRDDEIGLTLAAFNNMLNTIDVNNIVLTKMAYYDALTGLANRRLFMEKLPTALTDTKKNGTYLALIFIDLDKFKPINDNLGHDIGDMLLETVADRLRESMPETGCAYRLGGDEFTVILEALAKASDAVEIAQIILDAFARETVLKGNKIKVSASLGVAVSSGNETSNQLLKRADSILYEVKESGRNGFKVSPVSDGLSNKIMPI